MQYRRFGPRTRAAIPAVLITLVLLGALLFVIFLAPRAAAEPAEVYLDSDGARLIVTMKSAEIGRLQTQESGDATSESMKWNPLRVPAGAVDTQGDPARVAYGNTTLDEITDVRLVFKEVRLVVNGTLHQLHLEQDTLHIRLNTAGAKGDSLLILLDGKASLALQAGGVLSFTPRLLDTAWGKGKAHDNEAPERPSAPGGGGNNPRPTGPGTVLPPTQPSRPNVPPPPPNVGHIELSLQGRSHGLVEALNVTLTKIALTDTAGATTTWYENSALVPLVSTDAKHVATAQVPVGSYTAIHFETSTAKVTFTHTGEHTAIVPQPLLVLETPFNITRGVTIRMLVEIGVEESLRVSVAGFEYRPVVTRLLVGETPTEDQITQLLAPYPGQYRTGGSWLPGLGEPAESTLGGAGIHPGSTPHPITGDQDRPPGSLVDPNVDTGLIEEHTGPLPPLPGI